MTTKYRSNSFCDNSKNFFPCHQNYKNSCSNKTWRAQCLTRTNFESSRYVSSFFYLFRSTRMLYAHPVASVVVGTNVFSFYHGLHNYWLLSKKKMLLCWRCKDFSRECFICDVNWRVFPLLSDVICGDCKDENKINLQIIVHRRHMNFRRLINWARYAQPIARFLCGYCKRS